MDGIYPIETPARAPARPARRGRSAAALAVLDAAAQGSFVFDAAHRVLLCSRRAAEMLGSPASPPRRPVLARLFRDGTRLDGPAEAEAFCRAALGAAGPGAKLRLTRRDGVPLDLSCAPLGEGLWLGALTEVPFPADPAPDDLARVDPLTGLANRRWFQERLDDMLRDPAAAPAVLLLDLDRFKAVNDGLGHPVGDALLRVVARRLRSAVREEDVVARLGGDEFAVVPAHAAAAEVLAARLIDLLGRPYLLNGHVANIGASVGIAAGPRDGADSAELVRRADLALYDAKAAGRGMARVFHPGLDLRVKARHAMEQDLRRAIVRQQFELHYQPQVDLGTGEPVGFEALLRWRHPEHGLVPPDRFIALAEELGLIVPIGEWVLRTACREAASWPRGSQGGPRVAVNVSPRQLVDGARLHRAVAGALAASGLPGSRLEVEITESTLAADEGGALRALHELRAMGVRVSMDDFGTGHSSLSRLRGFPFDKVKLDRSFMRDLGASPEAASLVRAVAALGASLGMTTTAEGVETAEQAALVRSEGYTDMQGYLISRPVPGAEVAGLIARLRSASDPA